MRLPRAGRGRPPPGGPWFLIRRGVVDVTDDLVTVTDELADRDPVLAALASASVSGLPPAGPARRKPNLVALRGYGGHAEPTIKSKLCIDHAGFGLHARPPPGPTTPAAARCGTARTLAVWRDAAAMMAFVTGPAHAAAIAGVPTISRGGSLVTHFADDGSGANWAHAATVIGTVNGPTS